MVKRHFIIWARLISVCKVIYNDANGDYSGHVRVYQGMVHQLLDTNSGRKKGKDKDDGLSVYDILGSVVSLFFVQIYKYCGYKCTSKYEKWKFWWVCSSYL